MAQPTPYNPATDFSQEEANNISGRSTVRTMAVDAELAALALTLKETLANLAILQRDDTQVANDIVHPDSLTTATKALMAGNWIPRGPWVTSTAYSVVDMVVYNNDSYVCSVAHTSGTFTTDLANGYWTRLSGITYDALASTAAGKGASLIGLEDAASNYTGTDLESVMTEIATRVAKSGYVVVDKAEAVTLTPAAGNKLFVLGDDGGPFYAVTGAPLGTYSDNGGIYCGTQFIPTGGDGSSAWLRDHVRGVYIVQWFGAKAGATDNTEFVMATINEAAKNNGGKVIVGGGDFLCNTITTAGGLAWVIGIAADNIELVIEKGSKLYTTAAARLIHVNGAGKPNGMASWYQYEYNDAASYPFNNALKGDDYVTTTTAANAINFSPGDIIYIFTGQVINAGVGNEADMEINEVVSSDSSTGKIVLKWPLAKPYSQENYNIGSSGISSVGGAGTPAPMGVANGTAWTVRNFKISGGGTLQTTQTTDAYNLIVGGQILGFDVREMEIVSGNAGFSMGLYRQARIAENNIHLTGIGARYWITTAVGCTDVSVVNNKCSAEYFGYLHFHEGSAQVHVIGNTLYNRHQPTEIQPVISVKARGYDITMTDDIIIGGPQNNVIDIGNDVIGGGLIDNITIYAPGTSRAINVTAPSSGWIIGKINTDLAIRMEPENKVLEGMLPISCTDMMNIEGTATLGTIGAGRWPAWLLDFATTTTLTTVVLPNKEWKEIGFKVFFANAGAGAGDIRLNLLVMAKKAGNNLNAASTTNQVVTITVAAQDILIEHLFATNTPVSADDIVSIRLWRVWTDAADTLDNDIGILGMEAIRTG